jgi:hypothetical protein
MGTSPPLQGFVMLTVNLPEALESAVSLAAKRAGLTIDAYLTSVCADALSLEIDRSRVDSYLTATRGVPHATAQSWFEELVAGKRTPCSR